MLNFYVILFLIEYKRKKSFHFLVNSDLQIVQSTPGFQLKDVFHEKIIVIYLWTYSDIHSSHMMPKMLGIDKRYSTAGVCRK